MDSTSPRSKKRVIRILLWIVGVLVGLVLVGLLVADRWFRAKYEPVLAELNQTLAQDIDLFCEQQVLLAADPWFHTPRTEGDAGPLLNAWLDWTEVRKIPEDSPLQFPSQLSRESFDHADWLTSQVDLSTVDFGWMERLHEYDRWDFVRNTPVEPRTPHNEVTAPMPEFRTLQAWARLRLLQGLRTGQPLPAARDVRQLAWLMYRTDSLIGAFLAATTLELERKAYDSMQAPPPEWRPMSSEQVQRLRAVLSSSIVFSNLTAPVELAKRARSCSEPAVTRCVALTDAVFLAKFFEPVGRDRYQESYAAFQEELAARPCGTSRAQMLWERGMTVKDGEPGLLMPEGSEWTRYLPGGYIGGHIAGMGFSLTVPDYKKFLDKLHELRGSGEAKKVP